MLCGRWQQARAEGGGGEDASGRGGAGQGGAGQGRFVAAQTPGSGRRQRHPPHAQPQRIRPQRLVSSQPFVADRELCSRNVMCSHTRTFITLHYFYYICYYIMAIHKN